MSIELKQAAQQAVDAFEAFGDADDFASLFELTQKMRALRAAIQRAEAQQLTAQEEQEANGLPPIVAGAIFDFAGFMTTRSEVIEVGSTAEAGPVADLVKEWAESRDLDLADAAVLSWQLHITRASRPATPEPAAVRNPFAARCYTMSESHLSGHRLLVGFEKLEDAQAAHEWIARYGRCDYLNLGVEGI